MLHSNLWSCSRFAAKTRLITCIRITSLCTNFIITKLEQKLILATRTPREIAAITTPLISIFMKEAAPAIIFENRRMCNTLFGFISSPADLLNLDQLRRQRQEQFRLCLAKEKSQRREQKENSEFGLLLTDRRIDHDAD